MLLHTAATIRHRLFPSSFTLGILLFLVLAALAPATALAQECTAAVRVGDQFRLASSVGAGPNGVAGARLTLTITPEANFVTTGKHHWLNSSRLGVET